MHYYLSQTLTRWKQKPCELANANTLLVEHFYREETSLSRAKNRVRILRDTWAILIMLMLKVKKGQN